jgi:hypothetical protein
LELQYKIKIVRDGDLVSLKYDAIESPMDNPLVQQCRGMVVDTRRCKVLAWPYNKFWNHGEKRAAEINWRTARVQEKLDGSLMILYCDRGVWQVASSGHPTAGGPFGDEPDTTFREAFWDAIAECGPFGGAANLDALDPDTTYMLELCAQPNRVVVKHERTRIVMHGARYMPSGMELLDGVATYAMAAGFEFVRDFPIGSIDECEAAAAELDPIKQEGFVVVDGERNRVKIKSPRYVILHHMKGEATPRRAIKLWQTGEADELLAHFPEFRPVIAPVHERLDWLARRAFDEHEEAMCRSRDRKGYASMAARYAFSAVMFRMLSSSAPASVELAKSIMRGMSIAALERMLES